MFITSEAMDEYYKDLKNISNVEFTPREMDVIACILNGRTAHKEIVILLSISAKVVEAHKSNINRKLQNITRSNVREFIEKSDKYSAVKHHYLHLLHWYAFEETLKRIAQIQKTSVKAISIYFVKDKASNFIIGSDKRSGIQDHLQLAGFAVDVKDIRYEDQDSINTEYDSNKHMIFVVSEVLINNFHVSRKTKATISSRDSNGHNKEENKNNILFLSIEKSIPTNLLAILPNSQSVIVRDNYYFSFFELLLKLYSAADTLKVEELVKNFKENYHKKIPYFIDEGKTQDKTRQNISSLTHIDLFTKKGQLLVVAVIIIVAFIHYRYSMSVAHQHIIHPDHQPIRADLMTPMSNSLLERPNIIHKIDERLQGTEGIKTIALTGIVGMGGTGKTTIARYYGKTLHDVSVIWELNAETKDSLLSSFQELSYCLADTTDLKSELELIQQIQNHEIQEKQLLNFVKSQLKKRPGWVLIYDNMENFSQINWYSPSDAEQWGSGKVIVTTRNEHITETNHIKPDDVIHIDELSEEEMLVLFSKILYNEGPKGVSKTELQSASNFLKNIPPFPLDVSVAAYSIKNTHVTFEQYLNHVRGYSIHYDSIQVNLLKEVTDYSRTRYGIISATLEKLGHTNTDF